jgi:hypothetical protein|tara:strand:- start:343 stop:1035 length:693 start_codon:yes stop_codon:yes gene_type:complete
MLYAIGEIILVVIGILIALSINNWNENRKIRNTEQQYLHTLKEEFSFNKDELKSIMNRNNLNFDYSLKILDNTGPENPEITEQEFGSLLTNSLSIETQFDPNQGVIDEIINSGKLAIFSSEKLKLALSSWSGNLNRVRLQVQELLSMRSRTIEMVRNKANLRKVLGANLKQFGIKQTKFGQGNLHLLNSVAFDGHITGVATMSFSLNNTYYPKLVEEINEILMLIDNEIK